MKTSIAAAPPPPAAVDSGQASIDYVRKMMEIQPELLASEKEYRDDYSLLNLADMQTYLQGSGSQMGALDLFGISSQRSGEFQAAANTQQREADIADVQNLGLRASQAFQQANPQLQAAMQSAQGLQANGNPYAGLEQAIANGQRFEDIGQGLLGQSLYNKAMGPDMGAVGTTLQGRAGELANSRGQLTPDELRSIQQSIRETSTAQGRSMDNSLVSAEAMGRLTNERQRMMEDLQMSSALNQAGLSEVGQNRAFGQSVYGQDMARQEGNRTFGFGQQQQGIANQGLLGQLQASQLGQDRNYALQLAQMQAATASDPFQAILGRSSGALQYGQGQQGFAGGLTQSMQGPQLFDPNAGINLALQNNANTANYNASTYGARAAAQGASNAGFNSMLGSLGGGLLGNVGLFK